MVSLPPVLRDKAWAPHSKPAIPSLSPGGHAVRAHTHTRPRKDSRGQNGARAGFARGGISDGAEGGARVLESPLCPGDGGGSGSGEPALCPGWWPMTSGELPGGGGVRWPGSNPWPATSFLGDHGDLGEVPCASVSPAVKWGESLSSHRVLGWPSGMDKPRLRACPREAPWLCPPSLSPALSPLSEPGCLCL